MSRTFHLGDVLSITTGLLVAPNGIGAIYELLNFMTGDNLFTHQLPRATDECRPALLARFPQLAAVEVPDEFEGKDHVERWLAKQVARFSEWFEVDPLAASDHTHIDPIAELHMKAPHLRVIQIQVEEP